MDLKIPFGIAVAITTCTAGAAMAQADFAGDNTVPLIQVDTLDFDALAREDVLREENGLPPRYAVPHAVRTGPAFEGTWTQPDADTWLWQLRVASPDCLSINLAFEHFIMPEGAVMTISSHDERFSLQPITSLDNNPDNQYWTPPVPDSEVLISIEMDADVRPFVENGIVLTSINVGYRGFFDGAFDHADRSGSCNYDVECDEAEGWENEISCVAVISTGGSTFCTGFMVNTHRNDRTPMFMTANHCGVNSGNAASLVTFWNYQDPADGPLDCPGNANDSSSQDQYLTGSQFLASYSPSDFTLVRLNQSPPQEWEISFCGWTAEDVATEWSVAIHHPATDHKRWSIDYEPSEIYGYNGPGTTHLRILDWDLGTTEPGSSGSPVFDPNHRVAGQLHGGYAACGNDLEDWYGRFAVSWNNGLSQHLDPDNTGQLVCDTLPGVGMSVTPSGLVEHLCSTGCPDVEPSQVVYTIANNSPDSIEWSAAIYGSHGRGFPFLDIIGPSSGLIAPDGTVDLVVEVIDVSDWSDGVHTAEVRILDETNELEISREHVLEIGTTLVDLQPGFDFEAGGPLGGPFPTTQLYTATSLRPTPTTVTVTTDASWISVSESEFTLDGTGDSQGIVVGFSSEADDLAAGLYEGTVTFTNETDPTMPTQTRLVTLDVGRYTYVATDTPIAIQDNSEFTSTIQVNDSYCIADVNVEMDITHTFIGDLEVILTSPQGTSVVLHNRTGGSADDIVVLYDDDGGGTVPDGPGLLDDLYTEGVTGTWSLLVRDNAGADVGTLNAWALKIASTGDTCPPYCEDIEQATDENVPLDITLLGYSVEGNPLDYIITSLPNDGVLRDPNGGTITNTPYTLLALGDVVTYDPDNGYVGPDQFTYKVDDGTSSEEAMVMVSVGQPPNPDNCDSAFTVGNGVFEFDTTEATTDGPSHADCQFDGQTYNDIWYRYIACDDGTLSVSTCDAADYDTDLVIYDGDDCNNLSLLGCNDDADGCSGYTSALSVPVSREQVYLIRVGGWNQDDFGTGQVTIDGPVDDCNDDDCPGDATGDGVADVNDILAVIDAYGSNDPDADLDGDGLVGVNDILLLLSWYGEC
ncbi:MAG: proprotein convertase P-domain-containing protein [Phycisphaerales bacterium]|nr:proprotein convertase P-domain-containing protein [Phycisphaerales bacterium]